MLCRHHHAWPQGSVVGTDPFGISTTLTFEGNVGKFADSMASKLAMDGNIFNDLPFLENAERKKVKVATMMKSYELLYHCQCHLGMRSRHLHHRAP